MTKHAQDFSDPRNDNSAVCNGAKYNAWRF